MVHTLRMVQAEQRAFLVISDGRRIPLPGAGRLVLGREVDCDIKFDAQKVRMVGRRHAYVEVDAHGVFLVDLSSANKTWSPDGQPLEPNQRRRMSLREPFILGGQGGPTIHIEQEATPPTIVAGLGGTQRAELDPNTTVVMPPPRAQAQQTSPRSSAAHETSPRSSAAHETARPASRWVAPVESPPSQSPPKHSQPQAIQQRPSLRPSIDRSMLLRQALVIAALLVVSGIGGMVLGLLMPDGAEPEERDRGAAIN